jgi:hypothetical protein
MWQEVVAAEEAQEHKIVQHTLLVKGEGQFGDAELQGKVLPVTRSTAARQGYQLSPYWMHLRLAAALWACALT